ncbi:hypothetical protein A2U01_0097941, partial [Trifolium medium]|nr:hypothetical protein [Trifolium medium]
MSVAKLQESPTFSNLKMEFSYIVFTPARHATLSARRTLRTDE